MSKTARHSDDFRRAYADIPGLVGSAFTDRRFGCIHLLTITRADRARAWIQKVLSDQLVPTMASVIAEREGKAPPKKDVVTLAFSFAGLQALGLREDPKQPFPSAFRDGMASPDRRRILGDPDPVAPSTPAAETPSADGRRAHGDGETELDDGAPCEPTPAPTGEPPKVPDPPPPSPHGPWGDCQPEGGGHRIDLLVLHYRSSPEKSTELPHDALASEAFERIAVKLAPGAIVPTESGRMTVVEPFGFADGMGQPRIRGWTSRDGGKPIGPGSSAPEHDRVVEPGEFVLGLHNEYGERSHCPNVQGWTHAQGAPAFAAHGTYLAVRQIQQFVEVFKTFVATSSEPRMAEKLIGRYRNGVPLVSRPRPPASADAFRYLAEDPSGFQCPLGAHIRRANPRDALAWNTEEGLQSARLHQLLRRGRVYADDPDRQPGGNGLMFIALNADIERQFEFVQGNWIMGSTFAGLGGEQDPLLGQGDDRVFTIQGCPVGQRFQLPRFTRLIGGGYFLVPGMAALRFMAHVARPEEGTRRT